MGDYKYSYQGNKDEVAMACSKNLSISLKKAVETSKALKGKRVSTVIDYLEKVANEKAVVPYTRYNAEMAHRRGKGIGAGGFPVNVAKELLILVKSAQSNAKEKELGDDLRVISVSARKGSAKYHYGRYMGRKMKSTTMEVILGVNKAAKKQPATKKTAEVKEQ